MNNKTLALCPHLLNNLRGGVNLHIVETVVDHFLYRRDVQIIRGRSRRDDDDDERSERYEHTYGDHGGAGTDRRLQLITYIRRLTLLTFSLLTFL